MDSPNRIQSLQVLRILAAVLVLTHHSVLGTYYSFDKPPEWFERLSLGFLGGYLFFTLSGYVIARQLGMDPRRFVLHRLLRIYPPYFIAVLIGTVLLLMCGQVVLSGITPSWSLLLLPAGELQGWSGVPYWTLIYEIIFYSASLCFMLAGPKQYDYCLVGWAGIIIIKNLISPNGDIITTHWSHISFGYSSLFFIGGAALARLHAGTSWPLASIALLTIISGYSKELNGIGLPQFGISLVALVHICVVLERRFVFPAALVRAGDWSYGLYLIHGPIATTVITFIGLKVLPVWIVIALAFCVSGSLGLLYGWSEYEMYERLRKWADSWLRRDQQPSSAAKHTKSYVP